MSAAAMARHAKRHKLPLDFAVIGRAALGRAGDIVPALLPDGRREGAEWVARNPTRADRRAGSFRVNLVTGRWADFATGDKGGDLISLCAYLDRTPQHAAAVSLARVLGIGGAA